MKAGRPVREETPYKIIIHINGGRRYASTKINYTTEEGKKVSRHKHWGSIDENNGKTGADWDSAPEQTGTLLMVQI